MATNYPTSLDNLTNPVSNDSLNSPSHSAQHANANDAIEAIEAKLGFGPNVMPYAFAAGTATSSTTGVTVTFPASRFSVAPIVTATTTNGSLGNTNPAIVTVGAVTSTTVVLWVTGGGVQVAGQPIAWQAIQMTSSSASG